MQGGTGQGADLSKTVVVVAHERLQPALRIAVPLRRPCPRQRARRRPVRPPSKKSHSHLADSDWANVTQPTACGTGQGRKRRGHPVCRCRNGSHGTAWRCGGCGCWSALPTSWVAGLCELSCPLSHTQCVSCKMSNTGLNRSPARLMGTPMWRTHTPTTTYLSP